MLYIIALIVMLIIILILAGLYARACYWNDLHYKGMQKALEDHNRSELGFTELSDAYETDGLQYRATIAELTEEKDQLLLRIERQKEGWGEANLENRALRERIENQSDTINNYQDENNGLRRQLDIAQTIILEHDANCLPHIVLSSMEPVTSE